MNFNITKVKIEVTIPLENVDKVRKSLFDEGAGVIGNYTHCSMSTKCVGTFMPVGDANPYIGEKNKLEIVQEEKLEIICDVNIVKKIIEKIRDVHPYEEPVINIIPLHDEKSFD